MATFTLRIISPEATLFEGEALAAFLPGTKGEFEVLPHHAAIISSLGAGKVRYRTESGESEIAVKTGFAKFEDEVLTACVEL